MDSSVENRVDANSFAERVIQGSQERPIVLINGEASESIAELGQLVRRQVGDVDPSVLALEIENSQLEKAHQASAVELFLPEGLSVWWQGTSLGSIIATRDERVVRQVVHAASSRISPSVVDQLLQSAGSNQFQLFHRAVRPEIQPWVNLFVLYKFDMHLIQGGANRPMERVLQIVRPVWLGNNPTGVLVVAQSDSQPKTLSLNFASFNSQCQWQWQPGININQENQITRTAKTVDNPLVSKDDREFVSFRIAGVTPEVEFAVYQSSHDAAALSQALDGLRRTGGTGDEGYGDRPTALAEAMAELENLVGLDSLKAELDAYANFIKITELRKLAGAKASDITRHFVFMGSPGTGKTTVARLIGKILYGYGMLEKGHLIEVDRSGIVAGFIGQTAIKTTESFNKAIDGVFFIDEAYALADGETGGQDFGAEAIATLMALMENNRNRVSVIVAGYPDKMEKFLRSNPGLKSRFSKIFHFDDYSPAELAEVFLRMAKSDGYTLDEEVIAAVTRYFVGVRTTESFGNARAARQLLEDAKVRQANRLVQLEQHTAEDLQRLLATDVIGGSSETEGIEINEEGLANVLQELDKLVGLETVKQEIRSLVEVVRLQLRREETGIKTHFPALNFAFVGNPGTGKTTVARLLGRIFAHLGILSRGHLIEVSRAGLVAGYIGQTAIKTRGQIDRALDGVLFVDEAYALSRGGDDEQASDFGAEAIEQLMLAMENERDRISVVLAGYTKPMNSLLDSNPGLKSRVSRVIEFPDYSDDDLVKIFNRFLKDNGYSFAESGHPLLLGYFHYLERDASFGNARTARGLFEAMQRTHAFRISAVSDSTDTDLSTFTEDDLLRAVGDVAPHLAPPQTARVGYL